ncbi:hypothetical protein DACRYDRAFT_86672 [Dacryopinax primogenitus]|uniref:PhoD-like phosphatase metallophosphatase domain-containing protein n=1 Tax=Dacryopinax primogenitus (strain DJM 731) TaxID=1858805 RepID=M5GGK9_DACPD|nr:uncharacterized protein DACRYDRAFT_86672 [Dacryopinax primogenitus]EJU05668.1 hypothetical protein DACRYDRAFT_86672 [Dacryopinax primogenitus]
MEVDKKVKVEEKETNGTKGTVGEPKKTEAKEIVVVEKVETIVRDPVVSVTDSFANLALAFPSSFLSLRVSALLINLILMLFTLDFIYTPFIQTFPDLAYARVGAVTPHSARLVLRYPLPPLLEVMPAADELNREGEVEGVERLLKQESWEVHVWWRENVNVQAIGIEVEGPVELSWNEGPKVELLEENDWVGVAQLDKLLPATEYEYRFAFANSTILPVSKGQLTFRTFPAGNAAHFKFIASSCLMPNFPYRPSLSSTPSIRGFDLLASVLAKEPKRNVYGTEPESEPVSASPKTAPSPEAPAEEATTAMDNEPTPEPTEVVQQEEVPQTPLAESVTLVSETPQEAASARLPVSSVPSLPPLNLENAVSLFKSVLKGKPKEEVPESDANTEFALLLGDFIYADVPRYGGDDLEKYRRLYRRVYASDNYRKIYEHLPTLHIYDDHEITNNYVGHDNDSAAPFPRANNAYEVYQNNANYAPIRPGGNYYNFEYADSAFFVLDCRRYRTNVEQEIGDKATMLGEHQLSDFNHWLSKVNNTHTFKFVVSSVPFTTLWHGIDGQTDTWAGYPTERHEVLQKMASVPNVVIISGDRHEFAAVASAGRAGGNVLEFSTSPLNQFYLPLYSTFDTAAKTTATWTRPVERVVKNEQGEDEIEVTEEVVPEEKVLRYVREGQHKWGSFEVDTRDEEHPKLIFELFIDGQRAWRLNIPAKPVKKHPHSTALGMGRVIGQNFKHAMEAIGLWRALGL